MRGPGGRPLALLGLLLVAALLHARGAGAAAARVTRLDDGVMRYDLGTHGDYLYRRPAWYDWIAKPVPDIGTWTRRTFRRENALPVLGVAALTVVLFRVDQPLVDAVQDGGDKVGVPPRQDKTRTVFSIGRAQFRVPSDLGSAIYFFGDGWTHLSIGGVVLGWGLLHADNRAVQTGSQVFEAVLSSGAVTQVLKHLTGHESPSRATRPGGDWHFLPDMRDYFKDVPSYDAFPSGHLATATATYTVLVENYPEKPWIRPVGLSMLTLLGLQMMNNGVHWAGDYPVAVALGYGLGRIAVEDGREPAPTGGADPAANGTGRRWHPAVLVAGDGTVLAGVRVAFGG